MDDVFAKDDQIAGSVRPEDGLVHHARPIFIVGYMHTGTTLVRKIIGRHSEVYIIRAETMFFDQLENSLSNRFGDLSDDVTHEEYVRYLIRKTTFDWPPVTQAEAGYESQQFQPDEALIREIVAATRKTNDYTTIFAHVFNHIATAAGKSHWLEKTPSHIFWIDRILAAMPDARIIEMVRDPRDILASKMVRKNSDWADRYGEYVGSQMKIIGGWDPLRDSLAWRAAVRAGDEAIRKYPNSIRRVRYRDLASNPESQVRQLCDYLGLAFEPFMLEVGWSNTTVQDGAKQEKGIGRGAIGKWRQVLPADAAILCQMINRKEMESLGFELQDESWRARLMMPYWAVRSGVDLIAHIFQLWRARGSEYVSESLHNHWRRFTHLIRM